MTTTSERQPAARSAVVSEPVTFRRALASEAIKFRTLRSTVAVLAAAFLGMLLIAALVGYNTRHLTSNLQPDDIVASSPLQGLYLGQLLVGALGVLFVSGEYSTGLIRSTFAATPKRLPVLAAKSVLFSLITAAVLIPASFLAFVEAEAIISHYRTGYSLGDPGVLRVVLGTGVYLVLIGLFGGFIAWVVRSTPGSLVAYFAAVLVLPVLFGNVLGTWGKDVAQYLPSEAGHTFVSSIRESHTLAPTTGLLVLIGWVVLAGVIAAVQLVRRDA